MIARAPDMAAAGRFKTMVRSAAPRRSVALAPCAVRVVAGLHRGATLRLRAPVSIGSAPDRDVVLRDAEVVARHAEVRRVDGVWGLFSSHDGAAIAPFQTALHGRFMRQRHALGTAQLVITQPAPASARRTASRRDRLVTPWVLVFAAMLGALVGVQWLKPAEASPALPLTQALRDQGWPDVVLVTAPGRRATLRGHVDDTAAMARLKRWAAGHELADAEVKVHTGSELVGVVKEALAEPDLLVDYRPGGVVRVQGSTTRLPVRERLRQVASDLAGVARIDDRVAFVAEREETPRQHVLPVRIVDARPGDGERGGSFGTDQGARYFVGAVLSDGSEVVAVTEDHIEFAMGERRIDYPLK